jgi:hypothetical protein
LRKAGIFLIVTLFFWLSLHAQEKRNVTIDLGLSQTYKGFFYLFNGVVEVGAAYNHQIIKSLYGGASFHMDYLSRSNSSARTIVYKPKLNINYNIKTTPWLSINPMVFAGYSFVNISNGEFNYAETQTGFNSGAELKIIWYSDASVDYFLFGRFDFIYLNEDRNFTQLEYYRKVYLTSFGLGIKIKPKKEHRILKYKEKDQ